MTEVSMTDLPQSLHARLRDALRALILDGRLAPGTKLPSEAQLQAEHGVSRITVRQALAALQSDGLIIKRHGKGAFVARADAAPRLDRLEGLDEALAANARRITNRRLSLRALKAPAKVAGALRLATGVAAHQLRTLRYLEREPLSVNISWLRPEIGERIGRIDLSRRDLVDVFENEGGIRVGGAEVEIGATAARPAEARLLGIAAGTPVLEIVRLVHTTDAEPFQLETAIYRADRFRCRLTQNRGLS